MIRLFTSYYRDSSETRQMELYEALVRNIQSPIDEIHLMFERNAPLGDLPGVVKWPRLSPRPSFSDMFKLADCIVEKPDDIGIIANTDIFFDDTIKLASRLQPDECWALTRYEGGKLFSFPDGRPRCDSQDAWIFKGDVTAATMNIDYGPGIRGCDNALAHRLIQAGYKVSNPALSVRCHHLHKSGVRHYTKDSPAVPKPYATIPITELK